MDVQKGVIGSLPEISDLFLAEVGATTIGHHKAVADLICAHGRDFLQFLGL